jgi:hypothetical protein
MALAKQTLGQLFSDADNWSMSSLALQYVGVVDDSTQHWVYVVEYYEPSLLPTGGIVQGTMRLIVMMNGTAITPMRGTSGTK